MNSSNVWTRIPNYLACVVDNCLYFDCVCLMLTVVDCALPVPVDRSTATKERSVDTADDVQSEELRDSVLHIVAFLPQLINFFYV